MLCAKVLGQIVNGNSTYVPVIYSCSPIIFHLNVLLDEPNFLPNIFSLLHQTKTSFKIDALFVISGVTINKEMIEIIVKNSDYFNLLLDKATNDIPEVIILNQNNYLPKIQRKACLVFINIIQQTSPEKLLLLVQKGILKCSAKLLDSQDPKSIEVSLAGIDNILKYGKQYVKSNNLAENPFLEELENVNGIEGLKKLQDHPNRNIKRSARNILQKLNVNLLI